METTQLLHPITLRRLKLIIHIIVSIVILFLLLFLKQPQQSSQAASPNAFSCATVLEITEAECDALVALYNSTDGANWTDSSEWLVSTTPCSDWYGITCALGRVSKIDLTQNQLVGTIPSQLQELNQLQDLHLNNLGPISQYPQNRNHLSGTIPSALGSLTELVELYLDYNQLTGGIPIELKNLNKLQYLQLNDNQLSGDIPSDLSSLTQLRRLFLNNNPLGGNIPIELGDLAQLQQLHLNDSQLSGSIPSELDKLTQLQELYLSNNQLSGTFPLPLTTLTKLTRLLLDGNQLIGNIPSDLDKLTDLQILRLSKNQFSGRIPTQLDKLLQLQELWLDNNQLTGPIPPELEKLRNLQYLHLEGNQLSGSIPPELGKLTELQFLYLDNNQLSGAIPPQLGTLVKLVQLLLNSNQLSGNIPSTFSQANFPQLTVLRLRYNMLGCEGQACAFADGLDADWQRWQTVPPTNQHVLTQTATSVDLGWTPISYQDDGGGYEVAYAAQPDGPYVVHGITPDKSALTYTVNSLCPGQTYYFAVRTYTPHHNEQQNDLRSSFSQILTVTTPIDTTSLKVLAIYLLALDSNLSEEVDPILREIQAATADPSSCDNKAALVLADQKGDNNTKAYFIQGSTTHPITDFPDQATNRPDTNLHEYNMADGAQLGEFIKWGRDQYPAPQTILSFVGHGLPLAPNTDISLLITDSTTLAAAVDDNIFLLPSRTRLYAHADQLTDTSSKSLISPHALAEALKIGTDDGQNPLTVLDIVHCFGGTIEEFYEVSPYAQALIGAPNYTYSSGEMLGRALLAIQPGQSARYMAEAMIDAYDQTLAEADSSDDQPLTVEHPRVLVALQSDKLSAVKTSMDQLATALKDTMETAPEETKDKIAAAQASSQKYDTTLCAKQDTSQDWALNQDDALSDFVDFVDQLHEAFILSSTIALTATNVVSEVNAAIIKTIAVSGTPWFAQEPAPRWEFRDQISGIGFYTDFHGTTLNNDTVISLGWQAHWYNKGGQDSDNPHPLAFLQGDSTTWSDVLAAFWSGRENGIQTVFCTVEFPKVKPLLVYLPFITR